MKVQKVQIKNFKSIEDLNIDLDGKSVYLVGRNRSGKSSLIQAIFSALSGKEIPEASITKGQSKGHIEIMIGDTDKQYKIKLSFTEKNQKGTLSIITPDGMKASSKKVLDDIVGNITFDPFDFINSDGKKQVKFIKELAGIDFAELDKEYKDLYDERTITNRIKKEKEASLKSIPDVEVPKDAVRIDPADINKEIQEAMNHNNGISQAEDKLETLEKSRDNISNRIKELEKEKNELTERIIKGAAYLDANKKKDIAELNEKYHCIVKTNKVLEDYDKYQEVEFDLQKYVEKSEEQTKSLETISQKKQDAIDNSSLPVPGLGFDDDGLILDGLRFSEPQIAKSTIIETGIKLSMALNPNVKIIRIKDGSLLDKDTMEAVLGYIKTNDYQGFIEIVDHDTEQLKIEFVEE